MNVANNVSVDAAELAAINAAVAAKQAGAVLPLTFTTDGSTGIASTTMVNVTLYDKGPVTPPGPCNEFIAANDFVWAISTGSLTDVIAKQLSGVFATDVNGLPMNVTNNVSVNAAELAAINAGQAGNTFNLTFTTDGSTGVASSVTVIVTLYDNGPTTPPGPGDEFIAANDFNWRISAGNLTQASAKQSSKVVAIGANGLKMNVTDNVSASAADLAVINAGQVGNTYTLTFTTDGSTGVPSTVIVNVTLAAAGSGGGGSGGATIVQPQSGNQSVQPTQPSQPSQPSQPTEPGKGDEDPQEPTDQRTFRTTYSLLGILLLVLAILLAAVEGLRIYKQQKKEKKSNDDKSIIYRALVIVAAVAVIVAFFIMYSFSGSVVYYNLMFDAALIVIFVIESIFFLKNGRLI